MELEAIRNFRRQDERIVTGGQPSEEQLRVVAGAGIDVVINLALHDQPQYSLPDERALVEGLGMEYVHIPVQWDAPLESDLLAFFQAMDARTAQRILIHCAANKRVTAFLGLYNLLRLHHSREQAFRLMNDIWQPEGVWADFIRAMSLKYSKA